MFHNTSVTFSNFAFADCFALVNLVLPLTFITFRIDVQEIGEDMAPTAVSHPSFKVKEDLSVPKTSYLPTMNTKMAATKRKIICFSDFDG